jgi:methionyl-tRNA synthetase
MDLRVVEITAAKSVPKTEKLLEIMVDMAGEKRTIVSGIAKFYTPEELIGKHVILVANLKPAKLRGVVSHGMLLAASKGNELKIVEVDMPVGSRVK